MGSKKI